MKFLSIDVELASVFSLAAQQNSYPLLRKCQLIAQNSGEKTPSYVKNIVISLTTEPELFAAEEWKFDRLDSGQSSRLQERSLRPYYDKLSGLTEEILATLTFSLEYDTSDGRREKTSLHKDLTYLPADHWGGAVRQPDLLAAFVQPNTSAVEAITSNVAQLLRKEAKGSAIDGYQSNTRDRPYLYGSALWSVLFNERLVYLSPPVGWADSGQRIRSAADIKTHKAAACLDTSVLFASCLENMGLNPVIALTRSHAFVGFWLIDECFPVLTNDDAMDLRKRVAMSDLVIFETTLITNDSPVSFREAEARARDLLTEEHEDDFVMLIDIKQARARQIKPLGIIAEFKENSDGALSDGIKIGLGTLPVFPPVRADDRGFEETPETRIGMWQRKLLDLTKRNQLLNTKPSAMKIFCPDLGSLEDELAAGKKFKFKAAEDSPLNDSERDAGAFSMHSGQSLHTEYALDQLKNNVLIANEPTKRLDTKLIGLLRKAKTDLEEGGSNTLYLAIGMLRWKETPESERSYRAPLILLPAKLERKSAQAPVHLHQLPDEEPIFNLTLIEFLQTDYDISLDILREDLPEDESGVDVHAIWSIVREAIKEQPGFEVVEEIVLGSFSFAKYLMWKDLRDRVDLLKQSPLVEHLVDKPSAAYEQKSAFIACDEVDDKIQPDRFFAPLNCDSSQMVAVEASGHPQDFVLEGPPGTGKSETIANILCHNLALGRKVLFVAEKMAALQVVYRRMEKIGLSHLCLELHSNKISKKAVLDQLGKAWTNRETASQSEWTDRAGKLVGVRNKLNNYVQELHKKGQLGFSARDAIARKVRYEFEHPVRLNWPRDAQQAPILNEDEVSTYLIAAKDLGIAFQEVADVDIEHFSVIEQTNWSNKWRIDTVSVADCVISRTKKLVSSVDQVLSALELSVPQMTLSKAKRISCLRELCLSAIGNELDYALNSGAPKRMAALGKAVQLKTRLEQQLEEFGHGLKLSMLSDLPLEEWISKRNEAIGLFGWIKRIVIRKAAKAKGLEKIKDLSIFELAVSAQATLKDIEALDNDIRGVSIWKGVDTDTSILASKVAAGEKAVVLFNEFVGCFESPGEPAEKLRRVLVDDRDFLNESAHLFIVAKECSDACENIIEAMNDAERLKIDIDFNAGVGSIVAYFSSISTQSEKLGRWCRWLAAKKAADAAGLNEVAAALEGGIINADQTEENALTALCVWLAPQLIDQSPSLMQFAGASHENLISTFRDLDKEVSEASAGYIAAIAAGKVPDRDSPDASPEYGVLARELTKKTRHKPVRWLVQEMGGSLTDLTPCFMMSPLSVAQFLPADFSFFDLVVFDEASQITTWDAVGTIARGKNVIVVGDPKQMPPSNTFARSDIDDPDEADMESILDQALAARLPHRRLTGHYRSRHETLIAFSNSHYYENALTTFPSSETKESAVSLRRIEGVYAKGKTKTNAIEAVSVVDEVVVRLNAMLAGAPRRSLGIVTMNSQQQRLVEDRMDEARRRQPELEPFFSATDQYDPIFVKNLESVQGDERDIIILSLTYGPAEPGGKTMSMNFGPLNKEGGERRLNVAVTRATTEVVVFSSFDASMVDLSRTKSTAIAHLKNYLQFAEHGPSALAEYNHANYGVDQFDSDFEQAAAFSMRAKGWTVQTQVGVSKFRIDLGVIHPDRPGEYLAGIECDGATYHGSPSARDRDRVRQLILENLGWRILRLWSTDYFQDPEYALSKLLERLEEFLASDRATTDQNKPADAIDTTQESEEISSVAEITSVLPENIKPTHDADSTKIELPIYDKKLYFHDSHRQSLKELAESILDAKNGITMNDLALDVARQHGLKRSSQKQLAHLRDLIKPWAGLWRDGIHRPTVWRRPEDMVDEISWRGIMAFGEERVWQDIPYQEQIGFARSALNTQPLDPIGWMFKEFRILRRYEATTDTFQEWIKNVKNTDS